MRDYMPYASQKLPKYFTKEGMSKETVAEHTKTMPDRAALQQDRCRCTCSVSCFRSPRAPSAVQLPHATA